MQVPENYKGREHCAYEIVATSIQSIKFLPKKTRSDLFNVLNCLYTTLTFLFNNIGWGPEKAVSVT